MSEEGVLSQVKRLLVGAPIPSHLAHHERLSRVTGLAVLSSDALSSVAYATEEILRVLMIGGVAALALVDADRRSSSRRMLAIVVVLVPPDDPRLSERRRRLHRREGQPRRRRRRSIAAAALLIDYVLTVAVSIAAGVAALTSAFPALAREPGRAVARSSSRS